MSRLRRIFLVIGFCLIALRGTAAPGADPASALRYRRVFVPQADLEQVARGLLPMKRDEFERRVRLADSLNGGQRGKPSVRIDAAEYFARLEGDALVAGQAKLSVVNPNSNPTLLVLDPTNLALSGAAWLGADPRVAHVGVDPDGRLACLVESTGTLALSWSLAGKRDERGNLSFSVRLPPAPRHHLRLALPQGFHLAADEAMVARTSAAEDAPESAGLVNWDVDVPGTGEMVLTVNQTRASSEAAPLVLVKEQTTYAVHQGAIDIEANFDLDVLHKPLDQLIVSCDSSVELVGIRHGEVNLTWTPLGSVPGKRRMAIALSPPLVGNGDAIRISASANWSGEREMRLPQIQIVDATWQEGQATVTADEFLPVQVMALGGCRPAGFVPASPLRRERQWQFQQFAAGWEIQIARTQANVAVDEHSALALEFGQTQIAGVYSAEISVGAGARFELAAEIPRAWIVDSIELAPADALADRTLVSRPVAAPARDVQVLKLALRKPLVRGRPVRLTVRAHHRRPPIDQWLPDDFFSIVQLADVRTSRKLLAWQVADPTARLILAGDEQLARQDPSQLAPNDRRLFETPPVGELIATDQSTEALRARLVASLPRFHADLKARVSVERGDVRESWSVLCTPEDTAVARFLVHFRPPISGPGQWRLAGEDPREVAVRALESSSTAGDESVFEVVLARPRKVPFEITAQFHRRRAPWQECALAYLPAAASQTGNVEVHAAPGTPLSIEADRLQPVLPNRPSEPGTSLRGCYHYEPGQSARLVWRDPPAQQALPLAWVESLELVSRYSANGSGLHEAVWKLRNAGDARLAFRLPEGASTVQASIEGLPKGGFLVPSNQGEYYVTLPDSRNCTLLVSYRTQDQIATWHVSSVLNDPMPRCDLPILASAWRVELAPGLVLASSRQPRANKLDRPDRSPTSASELHERNWSAYEVDLATGVPGRLRVYRGATISAWGWCLALAAAALTLRLAGGRWVSLILVAGALSATWVVLPTELAPLVQGSLLGLALGAGWLLVVPRAAAPLFGPRSQAQGTTRLVHPSLGATSLLLVAVSMSLAQPPQAPDQRELTTRRVVIPVDGERQPVGDYVYLEPELYDALLKLAQNSSASAPDWLLTKAVYRPTVTTTGIDNRLHIGDIRAEFEFETFRADAAVEFGFQRSQVLLALGQARLDGKAVLTEWLDDGSGLRIDVREAGKHRLEFAFGATPKSVGDRQRLEIGIPRVADCRLILPESAGQIRAVDPRGAAHSLDTAPDRAIHLGHGRQLVLDWPREGSSGEAAVRVEAEQLVLWSVRPGSVTATAKFRLRPLGGKIQQVAIELDPRLRVLPASGMGVRHSVESAGHSNVLHVTLAEPASADVEIPVAFLWAESSGVGNLLFPKIAVQADKVVRTWSGFTLSGNLEWKPPPTARPADPTSDRFSKEWGEPTGGPVVAFDSSLPGALTLSIQPTEPNIEARQLLECSANVHSLRVQYLARLAGVPADAQPANNTAQQYKLRVARELQVTSVQVFSGGNEVPADWGQTADGLVLITPHQPPMTEQELRLLGRVPNKSDDPASTVPLVEFVGASKSELELRVFRQADVRLAVMADPKSWKPSTEIPLGQHQTALGRLAAAFRQAPGSPRRPPAIEIQPNQPQAFGHLLVRLIPGEPAWSVEVDAVVELESGVLDVLRFELPPEVSLPLSITPAVEHEVIAIPGQTGQLLVVRPQRAIEQRLQLTIRGQLRGDFGSAATLPAIELRGVPRLRKLVALPVRDMAESNMAHKGTSDAGQRIQWATTGMQAIESSALPAEAAALPAGFECYEVVAPRPSAVASMQEQSLAPTVQAAQHEVQVNRDRSIAGRTNLEVLPRGARYFDLVIPPGCRLVHAAIENVPAQPDRRVAGRFRIPALSGPQPQHIEIVYWATLDPVQTGEEADFIPPRIDGATTLQTRWSVSPASWSQTARGVRIRLPSAPPSQSDAWLVWLVLVALATATLAWLASQATLRSRLGRHAPLLFAIGGALWLAAGPWPWLGWLAIGAAAWLAFRFPWPMSTDRPLSSVMRRNM
ncbi:MAG: hypothetical protein L0211_27335 [Planctomycetaceae bacterium]|nr:hypothetical protein [Planctomycetaceae bacterium]